MKMDEAEKGQTIKELEKLIREFRSYKRLEEKSPLSKNQEGYMRSLQYTLQRKIGTYKEFVVRLTGKRYAQELNYKFDFWDEALRSGGLKSRTLLSIEYCIQACNEAIGKVNELNIESKNLKKEGEIMNEEPPKAFIAHEGETKALGKLKTFLDALGVKYLIAEIEPSNGRLIEPQVTRTYGNADLAIILATKGKVIDKQKKNVYYMGMNVADELGRAREVFKNRIILLLETGVQPHTNISGIVNERFKPQSMDNAFIKIAKELRNWGFIRVGKIEEQT
jgi:predicted nucleotide-binding protein